MAVNLLRPVILERAEEIDRRLRNVERDPSNNILPPPPLPAAFRVPASPVPGIQTNMALKYPPVPDMPRAPSPPDLLAADPRMLGTNIGGANPIDAKYWKSVTESNLSREEIRRVIQRNGWDENEVALLENRVGEAAIIFAMNVKRNRIRKLRRERIMVGNLMIDRAVAPRLDAESQAQRLADLRNYHLERDTIRFMDRKVEAAARDLAALLAATAYHLFRK